MNKKEALIKKKKAGVESESISKASKAFTDDYYSMQSHPSGAVRNDENIKSVMDEVLEDEELRAFFSMIVDAMVSSGYKIVGDESKVEAAKDKLKKIKFSKALKQTYFSNLVFLHGFTEIISNASGNDVSELRVLDPSRIEPVVDEYGELLSWEYDNPTGKDIMFDKDEVAHFSIESLTTTFWSTTYINTLKDIIDLKKKIMGHIHWLFDTNQFRNHLHVERASEEDATALANLIKGAMQDKEKLLVTFGEGGSSKPMESTDTLAPLIELLNMIRNKLLTLIRVPPIIAGTVDNSNRSNSEVQARYAYANRLNSFKRDIEDEINNELFPKIGLDSVSLVHNESDLKDWKTMVELAVSLIGSGADKDMMVKWLNDNGLDFPEDLFESDEEESEGLGLELNEEDPSTDNGGEVDLPRNSPLYESRKPQDNFMND